MGGSRVVAVAVALIFGVTACSANEESAESLATQSASRFFQAWQDQKPTGSNAADRQIEDLGAKLQISGTSIDVPETASCNEQDTRCQTTAELTHTLDGVGEWRYETTAALAKSDEGEWVVQWTPAAFHPKLTAETTLSRERERPRRAAILGAGGTPLTAETTVRRIGVVAGKVKFATYARLADLLGIDAAALRANVEAAKPDWFVPVITLRESQYRMVGRELLEVPGVSVDEDVWSLTKSPTWARALIGSVAPATEETLKEAGPLAAATDVVGASGLQVAFEQRLAGTPGGAVNLVDAQSGARLDQLWRTPAKPGDPLRTTVDMRVQDAAEAAVSEQAKTTSLVAVRASTGEILASAIGPGIQSYNMAFVGEYPPGSTFKVVSAAALLDSGIVTAKQSVPCPPTTTVEGKSFKNYDDFEPVDMDPSFAENIAASCNTAVVSQAAELPDDAISTTAATLGLGAEWGLGVPSFSGDVPPATSMVDRAASMIGQGRVLASPLAMATVAAVIDSGQPRAPRLLADAEAEPLEPLDARLARDLREMMRLTVTKGTASSLDLPGQPVHAKTGTAEIDSDDPSKTHAWIIGFRGDVAFAVLVENGASGSEDAAPVVRAFLERLPAS